MVYKTNQSSSFKYKGQATYQISVAGHLDETMGRFLGGMTISYQKTSKNDISTLTGDLIDQSALNGVLNTLFNHRYTVLSVLKLNG